MQYMLWLKSVVEYMAGVGDEPPENFRLSLASPLWGFWWAVLAALIIIFSGQSSKFIYIDF